MSRANCHFFAGIRLDVAKPVRTRTKSIHYDHLRTLLSILDDFEDGLTGQAGATADVCQQQEAVSEQNA